MDKGGGRDCEEVENWTRKVEEVWSDRKVDKVDYGGERDCLEVTKA